MTLRRIQRLPTSVGLAQARPNNYIDKRPIKEPYMKELKSIADTEDSC